MKTSTVQRYTCETCGTTYDTEDAARLCESRPVSQDKGAKVGDSIRIIRGEGQGLAKVENRFIYDRAWGHYAWERYWHTVGLQAKCANGYGHRQLTFDDYEVVAPVSASTTTEGKP